MKNQPIVKKSTSVRTTAQNTAWAYSAALVGMLGSILVRPADAQTGHLGAAYKDGVQIDREITPTSAAPTDSLQDPFKLSVFVTSAAFIFAVGICVGILSHMSFRVCLKLMERRRLARLGVVPQARPIAAIAPSTVVTTKVTPLESDATSNEVTVIENISRDEEALSCNQVAIELEPVVTAQPQPVPEPVAEPAPQPQHEPIVVVATIESEPQPVVQEQPKAQIAVEAVVVPQIVIEPPAPAPIPVAVPVLTMIPNPPMPRPRSKIAVAPAMMSIVEESEVAIKEAEIVQVLPKVETKPEQLPPPKPPRRKVSFSEPTEQVDTASAPTTLKRPAPIKPSRESLPVFNTAEEEQRAIVPSASQPVLSSNKPRGRHHLKTKPNVTELDQEVSYLVGQLKEVRRERKVAPARPAPTLPPRAHSKEELEELEAISILQKALGTQSLPRAKGHHHRTPKRRLSIPMPPPTATNIITPPPEFDDPTYKEKPSVSGVI